MRKNFRRILGLIERKSERFEHPMDDIQHYQLVHSHMARGLGISDEPCRSGKGKTHKKKAEQIGPAC